MDDGRIWCCVLAALRAVAALFKQVDTVRPESQRLTSAVEAQQRTDKRGRAVADVDEVVRAVAGTWPPSAPISVSRCRRCSRRATSTATACYRSAFERSWSWWRRRWSTSYGSCTRLGCLARADEADEAKREDERRRDAMGATATRR